VPNSISFMFGKAPLPPQEFANIAALTTFLGASQKELLVIRKHRSKMYSHFTLPKRAGGVRFITAPNARLLFLQRKLLCVFTGMYKPRKSVHGFVATRSAISNAEEHINRNHVLNIDLKDFFPSITEGRISGLLKVLGIPNDVRSAILSICCFNNRLPQGAPCSPVLANMICLRMDRQLMGFCKTRRIRYSRYADDLSFSLYAAPHQLFSDGVPNPGKLNINYISEELLAIISDNGFSPNEEKLRYFGPSSRKEVTGLVVTEIVNVPRKYIRTIRAILYDIEATSYDAAQVKFSTKHKKIGSLREHLRGKISWVAQVKGVNDGVYIGLARRFNALFPHSSLHVGHSKEQIRSLATWVLEKDEGNVDKQSQGTAFFLKNHGLVTAYHCVKDATKIEIYHPTAQSKRYSVNIIKYCKYRDLAILEHKIPPEEYLELEAADRLQRTGDPIRILGFPSFGPGSDLQVRDAKIVSGQTKSGVRQLVVDGKINQGNSGGPVVDQFDRVVGIAHKGGPNEALDIAIAIDEISQMD
jgi:RNA-directed DNA polymerase